MSRSSWWVLTLKDPYTSNADVIIRAHKQQVTIVRKSESSAEGNKLFFIKGIQVKELTEQLGWKQLKAMRLTYGTDQLTYLWKSVEQRRRAKCTERFHRLRLWCLQCLNWTDNRNNWHPWFFGFLFPLSFNYLLGLGKRFYSRFHLRRKLRFLLLSFRLNCGFRVRAFWKEPRKMFKEGELGSSVISSWKGWKLSPLVVRRSKARVFDDNIEILDNWTIWKRRTSITYSELEQGTNKPWV